MWDRGGVKGGVRVWDRGGVKGGVRCGMREE